VQKNRREILRKKSIVKTKSMDVVKLAHKKEDKSHSLLESGSEISNQDVSDQN
jgi:hypothetical protein